MSRRGWNAGLIAGFLVVAAHADDAPPATSTTPVAPPAAEATTASQIGRSILVVNNVDGQAGDAPARHITVNDDIVFAEDITTGADAKTVIEFRDGSTFELGPEAAVRIDSFVFNPEESTSHKALAVTRGAFRYVSAFVASDQDTKISTPAGELGIRGSVAEGIVDPAVPDFLYLGEGNATFTNSAGSSTLQAGNSVAVPSAGTPPMAGDAMPAAIAAQALQAIEARLPPRAALTHRPAADDAWLKRAGAADLLPAADQQRAAAAAATSRPLPAATGATGRGALAGELGLLVEANRLNLFNGRQTGRTPEQAAFLARAARDNPSAPAMMRRFNGAAQAMHSAAVAAGTEFVLRGVGRAAPSAEVMRRVTAATVRANPGAATIAHRAADSSRGPDRGDLARTARPPERTPAKEPAKQPRAAERKEPNRDSHAAPPRRPAAKPPEKKPPPKKKPGDQDRERR